MVSRYEVSSRIFYLLFMRLLYPKPLCTNDVEQGISPCPNQRKLNHKEHEGHEEKEMREVLGRIKKTSKVSETSEVLKVAMGRT